MRQSHEHKHEKNITRLSLDMSLEEHTHLKMMATKHGISMREYIFEALAFKEAAEKKAGKDEIEMDDETFKKALKRVRKEHYKLGHNLAKR